MQKKKKNQGIGSSHFQNLYKGDRAFIISVDRLRVFKKNNSPSQAAFILGTNTWFNYVKSLYISH